MEHFPQVNRLSAVVFGGVSMLVACVVTPIRALRTGCSCDGGLRRCQRRHAADSHSTGSTHGLRLGRTFLFFCMAVTASASPVLPVEKPANERIRIYQLFVRLFGNTNETRKPNGTLSENGVGKFSDINDAALDSLKALGFTHIWLTGVLQQATGTDYSSVGQPATIPRCLKESPEVPTPLRIISTFVLTMPSIPKIGLENLRRYSSECTRIDSAL